MKELLGLLIGMNLILEGLQLVSEENPGVTKIPQISRLFFTEEELIYVGEGNSEIGKISQ